MALIYTIAACGAFAADEAALKMPVVGIDLGTTYSVVAVWNEGTNDVEIIPNELGNRITPSVVAFTDSGERLVGDAAKNQMAANPENTIAAIKRIIGRKFSDPTVQLDRRNVAYKIVADADNRPVVEVRVGGVPRRLTPEEVSGAILAKMRAVAEAHLGVPVGAAVVTVPAYFTDAQRQATQDAGRVAGLRVARIINEPTAAAMAFGLGKAAEKRERTVLVFDLGGGTFDVSLLSIAGGFFDVVATAGDTHLGGEDFDLRLLHHLAAVYKARHGGDVLRDARATARLKRASELAKRELSSNPEARVEVDDLLGVDFSERVTRAKFEDLCADLFRATLAPVAQVLADGKVAKSAVDDVVLVGGSTRIPKVQQLLRAFFDNRVELNRGVNPDEAVAYGAAVQAAVLAGVEAVDDVVLMDVVPLSLGIETVGGVMTRVIERNTHKPVTKTQVFTTHKDQQSEVLVQVFEGERGMTRDNRALGDFKLDGIPPAPRNVPHIEVTFAVDADGILTVSALEKGTGKTKSLTIQSSKGGLTAAEVEELVRAARAHEEADKALVETAAARNGLESLAYSLRSQIRGDDKLAGKLGEEDKAEVERAVAAAIAWLDANAGAAKDEIDEQLSRLQRVADPIISSVYERQGGERREDTP